VGCAIDGASRPRCQQLSAWWPLVRWATRRQSSRTSGDLASTALVWGANPPSRRWRSSLRVQTLDSLSWPCSYWPSRQSGNLREAPHSDRDLVFGHVCSSSVHSSLRGSRGPSRSLANRAGAERKRGPGTLDARSRLLRLHRRSRCGGRCIDGPGLCQCSPRACSCSGIAEASRFVAQRLATSADSLRSPRATQPVFSPRLPSGSSDRAGPPGRELTGE
jgi:hypothetical protein